MVEVSRVGSFAPWRNHFLDRHLASGVDSQLRALSLLGYHQYSGILGS